MIISTIKNPSQIRPLGNKILVRKDSLPDKTESGIILVEHRREAPKTGTVLAVGDGFFTQNGINIPLQIKVDDRVLFLQNAGISVDCGKETLYIMSETDIIGILENEST